MIIDKNFTVLAYMRSEDLRGVIKRICVDESISYIDASNRVEFLESFLDNEPDLIVFHTDIGEDEIIEVLEVLKADSLYRTVPTIVISKLEDNDSFALKLSEYVVISILAYENWKYQCQRLLTHLKSEHEHTSRIHNHLLRSVSQNSIDPLTGALNRVGAENTFQNLVGYYASNGEFFSIIILDIDHFKNVNDIHGHSMGDEVLVEVSSVIKNSIRKDDALIRFGGEEFIVFLSDSDLEVAKRSAEKLRLLIESTLFSSSRLQITASFGVVQYSPDESMNLLIEKADQLLYAAKAGGRNQVCSA